MKSIKVIYQDDALLVLDKPPALVVDRAETVKGETLMDWLRDYYDRLEYHSEDIPQRMGLVHRLDKDTSGVILIAKTSGALGNLQRQFKQRQVKKEYMALVHGLVTEPGRVEAAVARNPSNREKFTVALQGDALEAREAVTEYIPVGKFQIPSTEFQTIFNDLNKIQMRKLERQHYGVFTLLRCFPKTGRTHQIRVHLKYINHPIVSDEKYGGRKISRLDKRWCPRIFLHAAKIGFNHPVTGGRMEIESPLPEDLRNALDKLTR